MPRSAVITCAVPNGLSASAEAGRVEQAVRRAYTGNGLMTCNLDCIATSAPALGATTLVLLVRLTEPATAHKRADALFFEIAGDLPTAKRVIRGALNAPQLPINVKWVETG